MRASRIVLQVLAGIGVLAGNQLARWFGVVLVGLNAIDQMLFIPEAEAGENDHTIDGPQRRRRPVPAGELTQRATLLDEGGHALPSRRERR